MYELALFAGAGGGILGGILNRHRCVGAVEIERYPRLVLQARQRDGILPWFPIWDDITTFREDNESCREYIEWLKSIREQLVISGGFPCQDISCAGKGKGLTGERSGLWSEMARTIREIRPRYAFVENSPLLVRRGLRRVFADFSEMGYNARWGVFGAKDAGAIHQRNRIWIVAHPAEEGRNIIQVPPAILPERSFNSERDRVYSTLISEEDFNTDYRKNDAVARWVDRFACTGNGQVPTVVKLAWDTLIKA